MMCFQLSFILWSKLLIKKLSVSVSCELSPKRSFCHYRQRSCACRSGGHSVSELSARYKIKNYYGLVHRQVRPPDGKRMLGKVLCCLPMTELSTPNGCLQLQICLPNFFCLLSKRDKLSVRELLSSIVLLFLFFLSVRRNCQPRKLLSEFIQGYLQYLGLKTLNT